MIHNYDLIYSNYAIKDIQNIYRYISIKLGIKETASKIIFDIYNKIDKMTYFPYSYSLIYNEALEFKKYRKITVNKYIAIYSIELNSNVIIITKIIHTKQNRKYYTDKNI